jgi:hypothetical protein
MEVKVSPTPGLTATLAVTGTVLPFSDHAGADTVTLYRCISHQSFRPEIGLFTSEASMLGENPASLDLLIITCPHPLLSVFQPQLSFLGFFFYLRTFAPAVPSV